MISWHAGSLHVILLLCLFEWRPLEGWVNVQKVPQDQAWPRNPSSPWVHTDSLPRKDLGARTTNGYVHRIRRGATNISRQNIQANVWPDGATCPYKVISEDRTSHNVCFRTLDRDFICNQRNCKVFRSRMSLLLANVMSNSSVLLQWHPPAEDIQAIKGFYMNCSWNGTYTRFQCDSVHLGISCRDYLLTNVHENVMYRMCLQTLYTNRTSLEECVEFSVDPVGMQDIVIAMTAVGGSICVMLVIICLLVAYITENLMHPNFSHPVAKRGP